MSNCSNCLTKGVVREGGVGSVCYKCSKRRCQICRDPKTGGAELCGPCMVQARKMWLESRIGAVVNPETFELAQFRRNEKLVQLRHTGYALSEMLVELVRQIIVIVWGNFAEERDEEEPTRKKAA